MSRTFLPMLAFGTGMFAAYYGLRGMESWLGLPVYAPAGVTAAICGGAAGALCVTIGWTAGRALAAMSWRREP